MKKEKRKWGDMKQYIYTEKGLIAKQVIVIIKK